MKSWHGFEPGKPYSLAEVVSTCDGRIRDEHVVATDKKEELVRKIEKTAHRTLVWTPSNDFGWALLRTVEGKAISPQW